MEDTPPAAEQAEPDIRRFASTHTNQANNQSDDRVIVSAANKHHKVQSGSASSLSRVLIATLVVLGCISSVSASPVNHTRIGGANAVVADIQEYPHHPASSHDFLLSLLDSFTVLIPSATNHVKTFQDKWVDWRLYGRLVPKLRYDQETAGRVVRSMMRPEGMHMLGKRSDDKTTIAVEAAMIPVLILLSGLFAGLTLAYFSVDPTQLQILSVSGTKKQQAMAKRMLPIRQKGHLLLITLVIMNMLSNEALPEISNGPLGSGIAAVAISTVLVVIFAEIIPQSVCSRYGLAIGSKMAKFTQCLIYFVFPIGYPVAKLLEFCLGKHGGVVYRRKELTELIKFHAKGGEAGGDLDVDTVAMAQGALGLQDKTAKDAMTPIDDVLMLPIDAKLDYETLGLVVNSGHSRIPVYSEVEVPDIASGVAGKTRVVKKILGCLLVKSCVLLDPEDATPLSTVPINNMPTVPWDEPLTNMLNAFQEGRSHMAIVSRRGKRVPEDDDSASIMTEAALGMRKKFLKKITEKVRGSDTSGSDTDSDEEADVDVEKGSRKKKGSNKDAPVTTGGKIVEAAKIRTEEQAVPSDALLDPDHVEKFFEGLEGAPLGIVCLEDLIEELLQSEIYDEYDVDTHASNFVPQEAIDAARVAAEKRHTEQAANTPLPIGNDKEDLTDATRRESTPIGRRLPRLTVPTMPKFNIMRAASTPGRRRGDETPGAERVNAIDHAIVRSASPAGMTEHEQKQADTNNASAPASTDNTVVDGSDVPPSRTHSADKINEMSRGGSGRGKIRGKSGTDAPAVLPSAIPARLLTKTTDGGAPVAASPTSVPAPSPSLPGAMSEALLIERGRRKLAAGSTTGTPVAANSLPTSSAPVSIVTRPSPVAGESVKQPVRYISQPVGGTTEILSPIPIRKPSAFKSVARMGASTPVPSAPQPPSTPELGTVVESQAESTARTGPTGGV